MPVEGGSVQDIAPSSGLEWRDEEEVERRQKYRARGGVWRRHCRRALIEDEWRPSLGSPRSYPQGGIRRYGWTRGSKQGEQSRIVSVTCVTSRNKERSVINSEERGRNEAEILRLLKTNRIHSFHPSSDVGC